MDYFTVEIAGRAVASFRSENSEDATHFFEAEDFRDDLTILESEGKPLWDRKAALSLRQGARHEQAIGVAGDGHLGLCDGASAPCASLRRRALPLPAARRESRRCR